MQIALTLILVAFWFSFLIQLFAIINHEVLGHNRIKGSMLCYNYY